MIQKNMTRKTKGHVTNNIRSLIELFNQNIRPSLRVVILLIIVVGIAYPILLVAIGEFALPYQSSGSLITLDGRLIGSKLIAQVL
jgi:K+-transporting ATPase ATPase C chain